MTMTKAEIIASLLDQAMDKDSLAGDEADDIFAEDAKALRAAAELLKKSEKVRHGGWKPITESELTGWNPEFAGRDPVATYECCLCKHEVFYDHDDKPVFTYYCPRCGAKMDGGDDNGHR